MSDGVYEFLPTRNTEDLPSEVKLAVVSRNDFLMVYNVYSPMFGIIGLVAIYMMHCTNNNGFT